MLELLVSAFALGLLFNALPGAVFAETLRRGLRGGFGPAFAVQVGSLAGDFVWAVLGLLGAAALFALPVVQVPLALFGAAFLAWLAWAALRDGLAPMPAFDPEAGAAGRGSALLSGALLSLSNPMNVTYWAGLGGTVMALGVADPGWTAFLVFLGGFMASSLLWCFVCAGLVAWTRAHVGPATWKALHFGSAAGLAWFAWRVASRVLDPRP
jgi:threonine/homoserine/homoserine lactone efflux protein